MSALPQFCPTPRELDDLELLATGALAPLTSFTVLSGGPAAGRGASEPPTGGRGASEASLETLISLTLPEDVPAAAEAAGGVELVDPEGLPLARVTVPGGVVEPLTHAQYGPFRDLYLTPA